MSDADAARAPEEPLVEGGTTERGEPDRMDVDGDGRVSLALAGVDLTPERQEPALGTVSLVEVASGRRLDIVMGRADAAAIQDAVAGLGSPRPRAHDLLLAAVEALDGTVREVTIVERRGGGLYVAALTLERADGTRIALDARPSDALNVALRAPTASLHAVAELLEVPAN